jgi:uncharacterized protein (DUF2267 family)
MTFDEFVGQVHNQIEASDTGEALSAIRATLQTLAERLHGEEAEHVAAQLPDEIGAYMRLTKKNDIFDLEEFFERVRKREGVDIRDAAYHARVVVSVLSEALTPGELDDVRGQLPSDYNPLFEAGVSGNMDTS